MADGLFLGRLLPTGGQAPGRPCHPRCSLGSLRPDHVPPLRPVLCSQHLCPPRAGGKQTWGTFTECLCPTCSSRPGLAQVCQLPIHREPEAW